MKRVFLILIDGLGVGELPDAKKFGDKFSNTYLHIKNATRVHLPKLESFGIDCIDGLNINCKKNIIGSYGKMNEVSKAKDSTAGHWEISGETLEKPFAIFKNRIPKSLVKKVEKAIGIKTLHNKVGSGTELIKEFGEEHIKTKKPILYTSADSVIQLACCEEVYSLERIYVMCESIRKICVGKFNVGRVIARPFIKKNSEYIRTKNRKDFSVPNDDNLLLDKVNNSKMQTIGIGKIEDIFPATKLSQSYKTANNQEAFDLILSDNLKFSKGLLWANLGDSDSKYGHRNDTDGYAKCLKQIDSFIEKLLLKLKESDVLIITGDHGNDPTTISTNHSREYVPILIYGKKIKAKVNLGTLPTFACLGATILDYLSIEKNDLSILDKIIK